MKLPNLDELEMDLQAEDPKERAKKTTEKTTNKKPKRESIIPKSQYDSEGNPILSIPDLNDVDLNSEIDKFFGKGGD